MCSADTPAPLFVAPSALQATDCQIPGLLNLRLPVSALYLNHNVALCCRKRIMLTDIGIIEVSSNLVLVENSDSTLYQLTQMPKRCMVSCIQSLLFQSPEVLRRGFQLLIHDSEPGNRALGKTIVVHPG